MRGLSSTRALAFRYTGNASPPGVVEAFVWVLVAHADLDWAWLVRHAKVDDLQNRLGFLVSLATQFAQRRAQTDAAAQLTSVRAELERSRLAGKGAFRATLSDAERRWLRSTIDVDVVDVRGADVAEMAVLVGVEDRTRHVRGVKEPLDLEERLANLISDHIVPRLVPELEIVPWRRSHVLAIQVYASRGRHGDLRAFDPSR